MEYMKKMNTYEQHKKNMRTRYHEKIKNNFEEMSKRNIYYKKWYSKNKERVQLQRQNALYYKRKKEIKTITEPIIKISKERFILRFD